ncbi:iron-hydroxamate ABC transporter substrate-binding protein [Cohnella soli]|uniref:Iron-hydroxamate ABC transporter substrate-binding protein n=1 Tax=Cohnella soli TaxID=425005 RepID=A0ABW0HMC5_9BACL
MLATGKKSITALTAFTMMTLWLAACGNNDAKSGESASPAIESASASMGAPAAERKLTDGLGHEVAIPANPQRIIASYLEDYLVALGVKPAGQWTVASGIQEYLQTTLKGIPTIPYDLPFEAVVSFQPDLLITGSNGAVEGDKYDQYAKIAPTFVLGDDIANDWRKALLKIGEVLNKDDEAQKVLDDYEQKASDAKAKIQAAIPGQSAAAIWLVQNSFFIVSDRLSSGAVLYNDLGFPVPDIVKEISATGTGNWNPISLEELADIDADHLIVINSDKGTDSAIMKEPIWQTIKAVKNGNVHEYDASSSWLYYGPIASAQMIDNVLHDIVKQ